MADAQQPPAEQQQPGQQPQQPQAQAVTPPQPAAAPPAQQQHLQEPAAPAGQPEQPQPQPQPTTHHRGPPQQEPVTLDAAREQFYVAHRACERFSAQLGAFVKRLQEAKADDAWLSEVQEEGHKVALFHRQQEEHWAALADSIDTYVDSVKELAEHMAVADLKGEETAEAGLPENRARIIHPELQRFQLEKKARILGKIGGVPALPGMGSVLPSLPRGQILKATASRAAREIHYSKMEDKDASQLAGVFQFRKSASSDASEQQQQQPTQWQQEAKEKHVRRQSEAAADEIRRLQEQEEQLVKGGAAELAGALKMRQQALKSQEEEAAAAAASSYRRVSASGNTADAPLPVRELQEAMPELAAKLKQRQAAHRPLSGEQADAAAKLPDAAAAATWSNPAAPFGGELASLLRKRRESEEAQAAAAPVKATPAPSGAPPPAAGISSAASSELAQRLKARASRLAAQDGAQQEDQQQQQR